MPRVYVRRHSLERLAEHVKVDPRTGCWVVQNVSRKDGYAAVGRGGRGGPKVLAHRLTYERLIGPLTDADLLHHVCEVKACCNPWHLKRTTRVEHPREHLPERCSRGHQDWRVKRNGQRDCRTCHRDRERERRRAARDGCGQWSTC
jgi:hypothetical protein